MFTMKAFKYVMPLYFSTFLATIMSMIRAIISMGYLPFPDIFVKIFIGIAVSFVAGVIFPIAKLASNFAELFNGKNGTLKYALLTTLIFALYYNIIFSFLFTALAIGFTPNYLNTVLRSMPLSYVIGYLVAFVITPVVVKLAKLTCSKPIPVDSAEQSLIISKTTPDEAV